MKPQAPKLSQEYIQPLADVFKVLGDPTRLRILRLLMDGEVCVRCISEELGMGQSAVSHQLRICGMPAWFSSGGKVRTCSIPWPMPTYLRCSTSGWSTSPNKGGAYVSLFNAPRKGTALFFKKAG